MNMFQFVYLPLTYYQTVRAAPPVLFNLFIADLFSWIAIMAHGMFYTGMLHHNTITRNPGAAFNEF